MDCKRVGDPGWELLPRECIEPWHGQSIRPDRTPQATVGHGLYKGAGSELAGADSAWKDLNVTLVDGSR